MKKTIKTLSILVILSLTVLLTNCQQEEDIIVIDEASNIKKYSTGKLSDFTTLNSFVREDILEYKSNKAELERTNTEDVYDFTIIDDEIIKVEDIGVTTYTIKIIKNEQEANSFSNLIVEFRDNEDPIATIINYYPSQNYIDNIETTPDLLFEGDVNMEDVDYNGSLNHLFRTIENCKTLYIDFCSISGTVAGHLCYINPNEHIETLPLTVCYATYGFLAENSEEEQVIEEGNQGAGGATTVPSYVLPCLQGNIVIEGEALTTDGDCISTSIDIEIANLKAIIEAPINNFTLESVESLNKRILAVGQYLTLTTHSDFSELLAMLRDIVQNTNLSNKDREIIAEKSKQIYTILKPKIFDILSLDSLDDLNTVIDADNLKIIEDNAATIAFLPFVKTLVGEHWPQNAEQWEALGSILFQPEFLLEMGLAFIPGSSIIDAVEGVDEEDYLKVTLGIAGVVVDAFGGVIFKAIAKVGKVAWKTFKIFKIAFKYLDEVVNSIQLGLKTVLEGDTVKILDSADNHIGNILSTVLKFNYTGFGGSIITSPNKTTTILGRYVDNLGKGTKEILDSGLSKYGENIGGFNLLDEPNWNSLTSLEKDILNKNWLEEAFQRGDDIRLISNPATNNIVNGTLTQYGKELNWIGEFSNIYNYSFDTLAKTYIKN